MKDCVQFPSTYTKTVFSGIALSGATGNMETGGFLEAHWPARLVVK